MRTGLFLFALLIGLTACTGSKKTAKVPGDQTEELLKLMAGSYDSGAQAEADSNYYNISLHMYPIWQNDTKAKWLYVEQAIYTAQDKPYRQRVYKLTKEGGLYKSYVYTLKEESKFVGAWKTPELFNLIDQDALELRSGCEVVLKRVGKNHYKGETGEKSCESTLRGAAYATSIVELRDDEVLSWDQGWDWQGNQVWGATEGAYVFKKTRSPF